MTKNEFIKTVAAAVQKYAPQYGIKVYSPIIAQAILESGWGESGLAAKYHNYFGLKCGSSWTGKSVNLQTSEEYTVGVHTTIRDDFRVYDSLDDGIKGYFDFIQYPRYANLKGITDPRKYLQTIWEDGYATSSKYVENNMVLIEQYNLTQYDKIENASSQSAVKSGVSAQTIINTMAGWIGLDRAKGTHKPIIDLYNSYTPRARGYKVTYSDEYCDTTVSAAFIKHNAVDLIGGTECGVEEHIKLFKKAGIWNEDGTITPKAGDIICFNWDKASQPNDGYADHIGIVEKVSGSTITTIEGNMNGKVGRRNLQVGNGYIRGYATPKYAKETSQSATSTAPTTSSSLNRTSKWTGKVYNCQALNVRTWAGKENSECSFSPLAKKTKVYICDEVKADDGATWYYILYKPKKKEDGKYGFVSSKYIKRV